MNMAKNTTTLAPYERIPAELKAANDGKFNAKLTEAERFSALAAVLTGIKKDVVAAAFGIDRRTISHMTNPTSKHYKSTREKVQQMGNKAFIEKYFDEKTLLRIQKAALPDARTDGTEPVAGPNPRAKAKAGINVIKPEQCAYNHRVMVQFRKEEPDVLPGWWYKDMDGPNPEEWCRGDDASMITSQSCLAAASSEIYDR